MNRQKTTGRQQWSEVMPDILLEYLKSDQPNREKAGWGISIDTPTYWHYTAWMDLHASNSDLTYFDCEQKIAELFQPQQK